MNKRLNEKIMQIALQHHQHIGCIGVNCPRVQRLLVFGAKCAAAAIDEAMRIVQESKP